jgi:glycosyltransferase involved in cell wall biosynthesis
VGRATGFGTDEMAGMEYASFQNSDEPATPKISVVVVVHNMAREAPRTLYSLSAKCQKEIDPKDYEVVVVDNGSMPAFDPDFIKSLAGNFHLIRIDPAPLSPAHAVNVGLAAARGEIIGVMIDGARIVTPGLLHFAAHGARLYKRAIVTALGWYLGYDYQPWSILAGHDEAHEDALLESIKWPQDGYRLFEIATMDGPSEDGWLAPLNESGALFLSRESWNLLGGMDERFDLPGGGLVNLDTFCRALEWPDAQLVILIGEGTFHQAHGGVASGTPAANFQQTAEAWFKQYETLRGRPSPHPRLDVPRSYIGVLPRPALARFVRMVVHPLPRHPEPPLGENFDFEHWSAAPIRRPIDQNIARAVDLAYAELAAGRGSTAVTIARLIRARVPCESAAQRLLSVNAGWRRYDEVIGPLAEHYLALAEAYRLLGDNAKAALQYREALTHNSNLPQAHAGLAQLRMSGDDYLIWLDRLYSWCSPETVIEIGLRNGESLARVKPPSIAIGVDPSPAILHPLPAETHIFPETSDAFFARRGLEMLLNGHPLGVSLVDGSLRYEQMLKIFVNLERYCGPRSIILLPGTIPLDEPTQQRTRTTTFYTGDIWKTVLCLKCYRPDLHIFTIATPPAGLTVVTGLDPVSRVLAERFDEAVARFIDLTYAEFEKRLADELNVVPNHRGEVEAHLRARGVLSIASVSSPNLSTKDA